MNKKSKKGKDDNRPFIEVGFVLHYFAIVRDAYPPSEILNTSTNSIAEKCCGIIHSSKSNLLSKKVQSNLKEKIYNEILDKYNKNKFHPYNYFIDDFTIITIQNEEVTIHEEDIGYEHLILRSGSIDRILKEMYEYDKDLYYDFTNDGLLFLVSLDICQKGNPFTAIMKTDDGNYHTIYELYGKGWDESDEDF